MQTQPYNSHLRRELALLPQASISTIHSFCLDLLRREGGRVGLTPSFRVAGDLEKALLYQETMDNLLEIEYADAASALPDLADAYGGNRDDEGIAKLISRLYTYACSRPQPEQWLKDCSASFCAGAQLDTYAFARFLDEDLSSQLTVLAARLRRLCGMRGVAAVRIRQVQEEADMVQQVADLPKGLEQRLCMLADIRFTTLKSIGKAKQDCDAAGNIINIYDEAAQDSFKQQRSEIREQIRELQKKYCTRTVAQHAQDLSRLQPLMQELVRLTLRYGEMLRVEKQRLDIIDFNDMEHLTLALLADEGVACELQQMFDQILVDEYQDINEVQEAILSRLAAQCNLFVVGDVKQSIYRFRLAEPALFLDKYRRYGELAGGRRIDLNLNYRSTRSIIHGVNFIFSQLMREQATEIEYITQMLICSLDAKRKALLLSCISSIFQHTRKKKRCFLAYRRKAD